jgi:aspartate-semialdehyde dehydrogenase
LALPVAVAGKAGVEELADQSRRLFNLESPEPEAFPLQIAFNLLPYFSGSASIAYESALSAAAARLSGGIAPGFSVCWAPLFHGAAIALHVRGRGKTDADALRTVLRQQEGVTLMETELPAGTPTPATDALGSQDVFVGRIGISAELIRFWLVFDPNALEAARMVKVVENWIDQPAASVIT